MRDFLLKGVDEGKGSHLLSWKAVGKPVNKGGLEIENLRTQNRSLLAKWLWHFPLELDSLRYKVIVSQHDPLIGF